MVRRLGNETFTSKSKHEDLQIRLLEVIGDFELTLSYGEKPCYALRVTMINVLSDARREIEKCQTNIDDLKKSIAEFRVFDHSDLILWISNLSIDLKLINAMMTNPSSRVIDMDRMLEGRQLVAKLDNCRTDKPQVLYPFHRGSDHAD